MREALNSTLHIKKKKTTETEKRGTGEAAQWLGTFAALPEDPCSPPSTRMLAKPAITLVLGIKCPLLTLRAACTYMVVIYM